MRKKNMIKNVIFDLDGVLRIVKDDYLKDILSKDMLLKLRLEDLGLSLKQFYKKYITGSEFIDEFDKGNLSDENISDLVCEKFNLNREVFDFLFNLRLRDDSNIYFMECFELISQLKENGFNVFVLSNMNTAMAEVLNRHLENVPFDDILFSCYTKRLKPETQTYVDALKKWNADAKESIFIDDNEKNLFPFEQLGGKTFLFDRFNIEKSVKKLKTIIFGRRRKQKNSSEPDPISIEK